MRTMDQTAGMMQQLGLAHGYSGALASQAEMMSRIAKQQQRQPIPPTNGRVPSIPQLLNDIRNLREWNEVLRAKVRELQRPWWKRIWS